MRTAGMMMTGVALAAALPLAACSSGPRVGRDAPVFTAQTADGSAYDLADKRGTVVLMDFYANW